MVNVSVSATLAINEEIAARRARGVETIALGFGEASIPVHPELCSRLGRYADRGGYGPVAGVPALLEAAAGYWHRRGVTTEPGQVVAGPGTKPLLYAIFQALGGPVALPRPSWVAMRPRTPCSDTRSSCSTSSLATVAFPTRMHWPRRPRGTDARAAR